MTDSRARYGIDAPGVMAGLLAGGAGLLGGAAWLSRRSRPEPRAAAWIAGAAGGVAAFFGTTMLGYAIDGKRRVRDLILDAITWRGDERVLDVGTGRGLLAIGAARRLSTGGVTAIDIWQAKDLSANSRDGALANAAIERVADRIDFVHQDASALPDADGSFDVVLSLLCLHNIEPAAKRDQACDEMARVLAPGGTLVVGDYVSTRRYALRFAVAGLTIESTSWHWREARGPMSITVATRPR